MTAQKAFTLVELLVVVSIITILSGILIPSFTSYIRSQNIKQAQQQIVSDMRTVQNKAITGTLSDTVIGGNQVLFWGIHFNDDNNGDGIRNEYRYFVSTTAPVNCNPGQIQNEGWYRLGSSTRISSGPTCVYFEIKNGNIITSGGTTITVGHASGGTDTKNVLFNSSGLIYASN